MEFVVAKRIVKVLQMQHPKQMIRPRGMKWLAMPARGDAIACIKLLASVILPSSVGVALKLAPTLE